MNSLRQNEESTSVALALLSLGYTADSRIALVFSTLTLLPYIYMTFPLLSPVAVDEVSTDQEFLLVGISFMCLNYSGIP